MAPSGYAWYKTLTADHTKVSADLSYFPALVSISGDTNLGGRCRADGYDIVFTNADGETNLKFERELFSITDGAATLIYHVQIPALSSSVDTVIRMYYANASQTTDPQTTNGGTWDDGGNNYYKGVWHLGEPSGTFADSTGNGNTGTPSGGVTYGATGKIGKAVTLNGSNGCIDCGTGSSLNLTNALTLEAWVNPGILSNQSIVGRWGGTNQYLLYLGQDGDIYNRATFGIVQTDGTSRFLKPATITYTQNETFHLSGVADGSYLHLYKNGVEFGDPLSYDGTIRTGSNGLLIGRLRGDDFLYMFSGAIDEVRISNNARSINWFSTQYANQNSPSTFYTLGAETAAGGGGSTINISSSVSGTGTSTTSVSIRKTISSSVSGTGSSTANISIEKSISSTATGTGSNTSTITVLKNISSLVAGSGSTTATATVNIAGSLSSTVIGTGTTTATVSIAKRVSSSVSGSGSSTTAISIKKNVSSSISGAGSSSATATASTGEFSGVGGLYPSGIYPVGLYPTGLYPRFNNVSTINISSTVVGSGSSTANVSISKRVSSSISGAGSSSATATASTGEFSGVGGLYPSGLYPVGIYPTGLYPRFSNVNTINISSTVVGSGSSTANVSISKRVSSSISGSGSSTATVTVTVGIINISSSVSGVGLSTTRVSILKNISSSCVGTGSSTASIYPPVTDLVYPITFTVLQQKNSVTFTPLVPVWSIAMTDLSLPAVVNHTDFLYVTSDDNMFVTYDGKRFEVSK